MPLLPTRRATRISEIGEIPARLEGGSEGVWQSSDEALLAGYAAGDPDAAAVFVRRFQAKMVGLALAIVRERAAAEEVAQDAFVRAWRYAGGYDPRRGSVSSWLLGIVRNVALDRVRVSNRRREVSTEELSMELLLGHQPDGTDAVGERDAATRVALSLRALPTDQREAVLAVTLGGLTAREVSEATGAPLGTVKTRIRLGLRKVRQHLAGRVP
jgi:RNA polymerase sigma-70 factor (ECF subfamily)